MTTYTDPRNTLMAALSAAEHIAAQSPSAPSTVHVDWTTAFGRHPETNQPVIGVLAYFGDGADAVAEFATCFGVLVQEQPRSGGMVFTFADGMFGDVPYRAWFLGAARTAGLPSAWSAKAVA